LYHNLQYVILKADKEFDIMIDFYEKYSDLHVENNSDCKRVLKTNPGENRGDDMCVSIMNYDYAHNSLTLFLLLQNTHKDGFIQKYCLRDEDKEKLNQIKIELKNNPEAKENYIKRIKESIYISYEDFEKLPLGDKIRIINESYYRLNPMLPSKFSRKRRAEIRKKEAEILRED